MKNITDTKCANCKFADFPDYNTIVCEKGIADEAMINCFVFEKIGSQNYKGESLYDRINTLIVEEKVRNVAVDEVKQRNTIVTPIGKATDNSTEEIDRRFYTLADVAVYSDKDLVVKKEIIPAGKLIKYNREAIRSGRDLLIQGTDEKKLYIENNLVKLNLCEHCVAAKDSLDIILISHADFDKYYNYSKPLVKAVDSFYAKEIQSFIEAEDGKTNISVVEKIPKDKGTIYQSKNIILDAELPDIQLGRLERGSSFFICSTNYKSGICKVVTADGREGILLNDQSTYDIIADSLATTIGILSIVISIVITLGIFFTVLSTTGYLVFWLFGFIIIGYIVAFLIGAPLLYIANLIRKYL